MRLMIPCGLLLVHTAAGAAQAQTFNDVQIQLGAYTLREDGGDKPLGVWFSTGPIVIGKPVIGTFSFGDTCEAFAASSDGSLRDDATVGWRIELTPLRVVRDAVTFRLRWVRAAALKQHLDQVPFEDSKALRTPNDDVELTLRPGESWPVDTVRVAAGAKTVHGRRCGPSSSIRVSVDTYPWEGKERRLVLADLWLIERLPDGTEAQRSQPLAVRGLPNHPLSFYFDSIADGAAWLDIYGILGARPETGVMAVAVETRCRWGGTSEPRNFAGPQRSVKSEVQMKPAEIVEIRLPLLGDEAGPFAKREFSIRIRARQLR